jgi:hypothetical protein
LLCCLLFRCRAAATAYYWTGIKAALRFGKEGSDVADRSPVDRAPLKRPAFQRPPAERTEIVRVKFGK